MRQDESAKNGGHEWICSAFEEFVDPELKTAVQCELRTENFVLRENQEQHADGDAQKRDGLGVGG